MLSAKEKSSENGNHYYIQIVINYYACNNSATNLVSSDKLWSDNASKLCTIRLWLQMTRSKRVAKGNTIDNTPDPH